MSQNCLRQAHLFEKINGGRVVRCLACNHYCQLALDQVGQCGVRQNANGKLELLVHNQPTAVQIDPIEKKPLYHFFPGSSAFSIGTLGCNFRCLNCQNSDISQMFNRKGKLTAQEIKTVGRELPAQKAVELALQAGSQSIAYTYNEPTIWTEYALEVMKLAKKKGLKNVWVSNGYFSAETLKLIAPYLDAINIDIKSFEEKFYQKVCSAKLQPVLDSCQRVIEKGVHLEIATLVIPTLSDEVKMLANLAKFIKEKLGDETPWHLIAFSGEISWRLQHLPDAPSSSIEQAFQVGKETGLKYVYAARSVDDDWANTHCPSCGKLVIARNGFRVKNFLKKNRCAGCGQVIAGVF